MSYVFRYCLVLIVKIYYNFVVNMPGAERTRAWPERKRTSEVTVQNVKRKRASEVTVQNVKKTVYLNM
jgi:hypothetical protein